MHRRLAILILVLGLAGVVTVLAFAGTAANGLPSYTDGYTKWKKLNKKPFTTPGAHDGIKNVFASKARQGKKFPNGTVVVKSIVEPGAKGPAKQVAVARKTSGRWQWVEYERSGSRYSVLAKGALCSNCHMDAKATDWIFTTG